MTWIKSNYRTAMRLMLVACVAVMLSATAHLAWAQNAQNQEQGDVVRVGTYERQVALQAYHGTQEFRQELEQRQAALQQDPQQAVQFQQWAQQKQQELLQQFVADEQQVIPEVAQDAGVQIVAAEILYNEGEVEAQDLTEAIVEKLNAQADEQQAPQPEAFPGFE